MHAIDPGEAAGDLVVFLTSLNFTTVPIPSRQAGTQVLTRWELSDEERAAIAAGAGIEVACLFAKRKGKKGWPGGEYLQPIAVTVALPAPANDDKEPANG